MRVIVDNKIPFIKEAIEKIADSVIYTPGRDFTPELVKDADALIIRTRTRCNKELLEGSKVRFIATATIGFDHIDTEYCREAGIRLDQCPRMQFSIRSSIRAISLTIIATAQKSTTVRIDIRHHRRRQCG